MNPFAVPRSPGLRFLWLWGPPIAYMIAIHVESSMSNVSLPADVSDKVAHAAGFGLLALTFLRALAGGTWFGVTRWTLAGCVVLTLLYGLKDEWQQMYTPGRSSDPMDVAADFAGAAGAASLAGAWSIIRRL